MFIQITSQPKSHKIRDLVTRWLVNALALVLLSLLPGIDIHGDIWSALGTVLAASAILELLSASIRPVLLLLTLPINILSLGLFTLVINGIILGLVSRIVNSYEIKGFGHAILGALVMSAFTALISAVFRAGSFSVKIHRG